MLLLQQVEPIPILLCINHSSIRITPIICSYSICLLRVLAIWSYGLWAKNQNKFLSKPCWNPLSESQTGILGVIPWQLRVPITTECWRSLKEFHKAQQVLWPHQLERYRDTNECKYSCLNNRMKGKRQRRDPLVQKWTLKTRQNSSLHWSKLISFSAFEYFSLTLSLQALTPLCTSEWLSKHQIPLDDVSSLLGTSGL